MDLEAIYEAHFRDVYRFLLGLTENGPLAEELCPEGSTGTYPAPKEKKAPSRQALSGKRPSDTLPARHCQKGRPEDCHLPAVPSI